jgi:hypothetical protein
MDADYPESIGLFYAMELDGIFDIFYSITPIITCFGISTTCWKYSAFSGYFFVSHTE